MIFVFYFFAAILIWLSFKSFRGGVEYLGFFKDELANPRSDFTPFVSIIAPCRGLDEGLEQNLTALVRQDYPDYEVIFVVDNEMDEAVSIISDLLNRRDAETGGNPSGSEGVERGVPRLLKYTLPATSVSASASLRLCGENSVTSKMIVAPKAEGCSQKVENLREAVLHAAPESKAFVFVDSDTRPSKDWLRGLVAPLACENVGAATGYRWFISKTPTFGSELRSVWNASIASALGPSTKTNFCWGGSLAIRRDVFESVDMREKWRGTLSDDFAVTRAMNAANLPVVFVPQGLTASVEDCSLRETFEFTNRQMKITRVYATSLWLMSFVGSALFNAVMLAALLIVIFSRTNSLPVWISLAVLFLVTIFSVGKSWLRLAAVKLVLPEYKAELKRQFWTQNTLWILSPALFFFNSVTALLSRRMTWRGIRYELKSPSETVIIRGK